MTVDSLSSSHIWDNDTCCGSERHVKHFSFFKVHRSVVRVAVWVHVSEFQAGEAAWQDLTG